MPWSNGTILYAQCSLVQTLLPGLLIQERNSIPAFSMLVALTSFRVLHSPLDFTIMSFPHL